MTARRPRRSRRRAGYTLIEVMMAVAIMTGGALALMALHQVTIQGNYEGRQLSTASHAASIWVERLQRDAMFWTTGGPTVVVTPLTLSGTRYLGNVAAVGALPNWFEPNGPATVRESFAFDHWGRDTIVRENMEYCTNVRLQWVYPGQAMRADVRVWYARSTPNAVTGNLQGCAQGLLPATLDARLTDLQFVYASTVLRWTPLPPI